MVEEKDRIRSTAPALAYVVVFVVVCSTVAGLVIFNAPVDPSDSVRSWLPGFGAEKPMFERGIAYDIDRSTVDGQEYRLVDYSKNASIIVHESPAKLGKQLFGKHCASCHTFGNQFTRTKEPSAADLLAFGAKEWLIGLLRKPGDPHYFGRTDLKSMTRWVEKQRQRAMKEPEQLKKLEADFDTVAGWLATHPRRPVPKATDPRDDFVKGYEVFYEYCSECHTYRAKSARDALTAPDLAGYGDAEWIRLMIMSPNHVLRYSVKNRMPIFRDLDAPSAGNTRQELARLKDYLLIQLSSDDPDVKEKRQQIEDSSKLADLGDIDRELIIRFILAAGN